MLRSSRARTPARRGNGLAVLVAFVMAVAPAQAASLGFVQETKETVANPKVSGFCRTEERDVIASAFAVAQARSAKVISEMETHRAAVQPEFDAYFGAGNAANYDEVKKNFETTRLYMSDANKSVLIVYCNLKNATGVPCSDGVRAARLLSVKDAPPDTEATKGKEKVVFCPSFFEASRTNDHTRWGSMLHEMTHVAFGTVDREYEEFGVMKLAKKYPMSAIINAESYRQFAEQVVAHAK